MRFGVAGFPPAFRNKYKNKDQFVFEWLFEQGLNAFEYQMTYGPRTKPEKCLEFKSLSKDYDISITVHASYFIVFTSDDKDKIAKSTDTLLRTFDLCETLESKKIILHPGSLYGTSEKDACKRFIDNFSKFTDNLGQTDIEVSLETAGKRGQLGSVEDIIYLVKHTKNTSPCIDFGHVHARTCGTLETKEAIVDIFKDLKAEHYFDQPNKIHFHYTPIEFGPQGEKMHKAIDDIDSNNTPTIDDYINEIASFEPKPYYPRFEPVSEALKEFNVDCTIISETHDSQEKGALALKNAYFSYQV